MIRLKRVYEKPAAADGERILVERLWPRGLSKADAKVDLWLRDIAPSTELRKWFAHDPARWDEFQRRYWNELRNQSEAVDLLRRKAAAGVITLVYAARDEQHNGALALKTFLEQKSSTPRARSKAEGAPGSATRKRSGRSTS
jgi:uncharacterized protein YeaO (DUF488 family)